MSFSYTSLCESVITALPYATGVATFIFLEIAMKEKEALEPLLCRKRAAKYLNVSPGTLAVWDCTKRYQLNPLKIGRAVRYRRSDLDAFILRKQQNR
ncbi:MAG: helix-turn-helix domain-containing protein [Phycisphaerales bacterium]|nr:helix-turn-helix domain-containing protein [Phycisphaerales bacterium]